MGSVSRSDLKKFLNNLLTPYDFSDYGPNGLQIEGKKEIKKIAFAVSATKDSVAKAVAEKADCMIVHHGLFWNFHGAKKLTGPFYHRVAPLIKSDINLFGFHLPLDAHPEHGNAASLAKSIGLSELAPFGDYKGSPTGVKGKFEKPIQASELKSLLEKSLNHNVLHASPADDDKIKSVGIITGGANSDWILAQREGLHAYITGEMSEHDWHESKESGVHMFAGGHNATESLGIQALMNVIEKKFEIESIYIASDNPA